MSHTCNPSYSGGRHQENCGLRPASAKEASKTPSWEINWWYVDVIPAM
jgi:hypothetical protein